MNRHGNEISKNRGKTRRDKIGNQVFRENPSIVPVETTIKQGQLGWLRREENKFIKQICHTKEIEKRRKADQEGRDRKKFVRQSKREEV